MNKSYAINDRDFVKNPITLEEADIIKNRLYAMISLCETEGYIEGTTTEETAYLLQIIADSGEGKDLGNISN